MSSAKNILIVGMQWPPETFLMRLIDGLIQSGIKINIALPEKPSQWLKRENLKWVWAPSPNGSFFKRAVSFLFLFFKAIIFCPWRLFKLLLAAKNQSEINPLIYLFRNLPFARQSWDLVYFPWVLTASNYSFSKTPFIVSLRGRQVNILPHHPEASGIRNKLSIIFKKAAKVHCVSEHILKEAEHFGLDRNKAVIIYPAVSEQVFMIAERISETRTLKLITTGSLLWRKGYEYLLKSLKILEEKYPDFNLKIIGNGPEYERVLFTIKDLNLETKVSLMGRLSAAEVKSHLQVSDVFVLASLSEGISNAALEAMACGLPVVTSDAGGMREAVENGVEGFVVPLRDSKAMAEALLKLAGDPGLKKQMGKNARAKILKQFRLEDQIRRFKGLFNLWEK